MKAQRAYQARKAAGKGFKKRARPSESVRAAVESVLTERSEKKYFDYASQDQNISSGGTIFGALSAPAQGVADTERVGDGLRISSMQIRYQVTCADTTNVIRLVMFQWKSSHVAAPAVGDVLQAYLPGPAPGIFSPYTHDSRANMRILWDSGLLQMSQIDVDAICGTAYVTKGFLDDRVIQFVAGAQTGYPHVYLCCISDSGAVAHPTVDFVSRMVFTDV